MSLVDDIGHVLAPPHPTGRPFVLGGLIVVMIGLLLGAWLSWLGLLFTLVCLVAPADGRVVSVTPAVPPAELGLGTIPRWRVSIFLSVINVHVNRVPADGIITRIAYRHGSFVNASLDKASDANERNAVALRLADGREIAFVQIAGLIARRIVCDLREGDAVRAGQRFGIIRFGSRTDLYLPETVRPLVAVGQTMIGGETVIAELPA
jgi:phosphatidylserine decarboxylase